MLDRLASKFIKDLEFDSREKHDEIRRVLRVKFLDFCKTNGVENTLASYKQYRAVVRSMFGFDLSVVRPKKDIDIIETTIQLF